MSEEEKAIVRACLDQVLIGMFEAYEVRAWIETMGPDMRRRCQEFIGLVGMLRRGESLK
jgi:hypothetical protein